MNKGETLQPQFERGCIHAKRAGRVMNQTPLFCSQSSPIEKQARLVCGVVASRGLRNFIDYFLY